MNGIILYIGTSKDYNFSPISRAGFLMDLLKIGLQILFG